jgi:60 kDa SS-A/Ro ribonucleoprotein
MNALENFLTYGNELGADYPEAISLEFVPHVTEALRFSDDTVVDAIAGAQSGRAAVLALALAAVVGTESVRSRALESVPQVCNSSALLFEFCGFCKGLRGWGRGMRNSIASWYTSKTPQELLELANEPLMHDDWTHRDLLRMAHPQPPTEEHNRAFQAILEARHE